MKCEIRFFNDILSNVTLYFFFTDIESSSFSRKHQGNTNQVFVHIERWYVAKLLNYSRVAALEGVSLILYRLKTFHITKKL